MQQVSSLFFRPSPAQEAILEYELIPFEDLKWDEQEKNKLGEGTFGKVFVGECGGTTVAIKKLKEGKGVTKEIGEEVKILKLAHHPNVVLFLGACVKDGRIIAIVTEFCPGKSLEVMLNDKQINYPLLTWLKIARETAKAINWLHCYRKIIHRDLKPANILVDQENKNHVKVCDFGLSALYSSQSGLRYPEDPHTFLYMAPEDIQRKKHPDQKSDSYSFGLVLWRLLTRDKIPFEMYNAVNTKERPPIPSKTNSALKALIEECWHEDPSQRPKFETIINQLDQIMILDSLLFDYEAQDFWRDNFFGKSDVSGVEFITSLYKTLGLGPPTPDLLLRALLALLGGEKTVSLGGFANLLRYFGPMSRVAKNVLSTTSKRWFHGNIDQEEATRLLGQEQGYWLIRLSSQPGSFTISHIKGTQQLHRFHYDLAECVYYPEGSTAKYQSVDALIEANATELKLGKPCVAASSWTSKMEAMKVTVTYTKWSRPETE